MKYLFLMLVLNLGLHSSYAQSKKRKLIFSDEFNYNGHPDSTKWNYEIGFVRNKEPQYYTYKRLENTRVENGCLVLEARKESFPGNKIADVSPSGVSDTTADYTSGCIITKGKKNFKYGRIEVRAKIPNGAGSWPAIWMLGSNRGPVKWPECGEIDIMEFTAKDSTKVIGTVHYSDAEGTYQYEGERYSAGAPYDDFHVYAVEWNKDVIEFYFDGHKYFVFDLKKAQKGEENIFRKDFYLLLNLALGREGTLGGPLDDSILPLKYYVDYVRVYE